MSSFRERLLRRYARVERGDEALDEYQRHAVAWLRERPKSALFIDTGLGKTAISLRLIRDLVDAGEVRKVLIIAPLKVSNYTWPDEIQLWEYAAAIPFKQLRQDDVVKAVNTRGQMRRAAGLSEKDEKRVKRVVENRLKKALGDNPMLDKERIKQMRVNFTKTAKEECLKVRVKGERSNAAADALRDLERRQLTIIDVINHEQVVFLVDAWGDEWPYDMVVYDESSALKDASTKRWKALYSISHKVKRFHQLTATPASESYLGLWAQIKLLDDGQRLGRTMTEFKSRYFDINPKVAWKMKLRKGADSEISRKLADITLVMKQQDYVDLPQPIFKNIYFENPATELYADMRNAGAITLPDGTEIVTDSGVAAIQKCMQICSGFVYEGSEELTEDGGLRVNRMVHDLHDARINALKALRASLGRQNVLVSYYHKGSLEKLLRAFPDAVAMDTAGSQQPAWNAGKIPMLLMHPMSGAHGLNLQKGGHIVINYDMFFSYEQYYQFWRRVCRRGQAEQVYVYNIICKGSYDEYVYKSCWIDKKSAQDVFFEMVKEYGKRQRRRP